jgi:RNA polymerase sigma-70 factor (ECF subfamily)
MQQQAEAPETIFETLRPRLLAISYRILSSRAEAEDVIQETYLKWHRADREALLAPAAWLTTVVRHLSIDRLRQCRRETAAATDGQAQAPSPEDLLCRRADLALAFALLHERLSPDERIALVLHTAFECEHAEIAAALGTTASNSRQLLHRARERILREPARRPVGERLSRELIQDFLLAMQGLDKQAVMTLVGQGAVRGQLRAMETGYLQIRRHIRQLTLGKAVLAEDADDAIPAAA